MRRVPIEIQSIIERAFRRICKGQNEDADCLRTDRMLSTDDENAEKRSASLANDVAIENWPSWKGWLRPGLSLDLW